MLLLSFLGRKRLTLLGGSWDLVSRVISARICGRKVIATILALILTLLNLLSPLTL